MVFLDPVFNPVLLPLINFNPFLGVLIISLILSLIIVVIYKYATNQIEMKRLKDEQKEFQTKLKSLKDNPTEMMKLQKEAMKKNMDYMKHSLKPTLITFIPILLIFGWMNAHLAFEPIYPDESYSITAQFKTGLTGQAELFVDGGTELLSSAQQNISITETDEPGTVTWTLKSTAGEHQVTVAIDSTEQSKKIFITTDLIAEPAISLYEHSDLEQIKINYNPLKPAGKLSLLGWKPGWLGWYIIFSLLFSIVLRKLLKVY